MLKASRNGYMILKPDSRGLRSARGWMRAVFRNLQLAEDDAGGLLIAVGEAISNAYLHGTPDRNSDLIRLGWSWTGREMIVTVKDNGNGCGNGARLRPSDWRGSLARGVELMQAGADKVAFFDDNGAKVVLIKRLRAAELA
jgi:anti-sigma regulatory factor (Ser/Thr protein kinase)